MIHESIKALLGDELTAQVEAALRSKDGKEVELVVGNDGSFVPADKYEQARGQCASAEKALKSAAASLKAVGGSGDPGKIADDVTAAQTAMARLQTEHEAQIKALQKSTALRMALAPQVHDPADLLPLLNLEAVEVDQSGALTGDLERLLKPLREQKSYLFKKSDPPKINGVKPAEPNGQPPPADSSGGPVIF